VGLLCVAAICVAIAALDVAAPGVPASCDTAKTSLNHHLIRNAEGAYGKILTKEPSSKCALQGMKEVVTAWCAWGKTLKEHRATVEAVKVYTAALEDQPTNGGADKCALTGLEGANSSVTAASCPNALKAACNITLVNVYGVNGKNGLNGRNGLSGKNGANGVNGHSGVNGRNGANGKNGANGRNGRNGGNGLNGRNGRNGANGNNGVGIGNASLCQGTACP
jgi:hypothetical protein